MTSGWIAPITPADREKMDIPDFLAGGLEPLLDRAASDLEDGVLWTVLRAEALLNRGEPENSRELQRLRYLRDDLRRRARELRNLSA